MLGISQRAKNVTPSITLAINAKVKSMRSQGLDVIDFGIGEPDFDTPEHIKEGAIVALKSGFTKYTPASGTEELRVTIAKKLKVENSLEYKPSEIIVSCGAKHSLYNIFQAICDPGDEVIIPAPYWVSYTEMVKLAGGIPVVIDTKAENNFTPTAELVEKAVTEKTKAIVINSPSNPTGAVCSLQALKDIAAVAVKNQFYVISDEIYEKLLYDGLRHQSLATLGEDIKKLTFVVNGVSKTYAMTGWRIGYAAGPAEAIKAMGDIQSQSTSNPNSIAQAASVTALNSSQEEAEAMRREFERRRNYIVDRFKKMPFISCVRPQGAFYAFPDVSALFGKSFKGRTLKGSLDVSEYLLDEAKVALVPGADFGNDNCVRISFATSLENIKEGLDRIEKAFNY
jgi:aspartate aminotransferase